MRLGVFSPDDIDLDLDFEKLSSNDLREQIVHLLTELLSPNTEYTYREILEYVQSSLGLGVIY